MPISPILTYEESMINCNIWKRNMDFASKWDFLKLLNIRYLKGYNRRNNIVTIQNYT